MTQGQENTLELGTGFFTIPLIAQLLGMPISKINHLLKTYWDGRFSKDFGAYSYSVDLTKVVNFYVFIELFITKELIASGVRNKKIFKAHEVLSKKFNHKYPFADKRVIESIRILNQQVAFQFDDNQTITLDGADQYYIEDFVKDFKKKIDYDNELLMANRYWPLGKDHSIIVDPNHQYGNPTILNRNIKTSTIESYLRAGEKPEEIAELFEISTEAVKDVQTFYAAA